MLDADMLVRLSELFEVSVPVLLGAAPEPEKDASGQPETPPLSMSEIAEQLSRINEQMVVKNRRSRRIAKTVGIIVLILIGLRILLTIITVSAFTAFTFSESTTVQTQSITEVLGELYDALPLP